MANVEQEKYTRRVLRDQVDEGIERGREKVISRWVRDPSSIHQEFKGDGDTFDEEMKSNSTFRTRARISRGRAATSESGRNNDKRSTCLQALSPSQSKRDLLRVDVGSL
ncbi:hypothetical protein FRC18_006015 [Serendipita sp. 400]|nr:hypothetical protein FRC18_006015 [Serendipita sp. 400]